MWLLAVEDQEAAAGEAVWIGGARAEAVCGVLHEVATGCKWWWVLRCADCSGVEFDSFGAKEASAVKQLAAELAAELASICGAFEAAHQTLQQPDGSAVATVSRA